MPTQLPVNPNKELLEQIKESTDLLKKSQLQCRELLQMAATLAQGVSPSKRDAQLRMQDHWAKRLTNVSEQLEALVDAHEQISYQRTQIDPEFAELLHSMLKHSNLLFSEINTTHENIQRAIAIHDPDHPDYEPNDKKAAEKTRLSVQHCKMEMMQAKQTQH